MDMQQLWNWIGLANLLWIGHYFVDWSLSSFSCYGLVDWNIGWSNWLFLKEDWLRRYLKCCIFIIYIVKFVLLIFVLLKVLFYLGVYSLFPILICLFSPSLASRSAHFTQVFVDKRWRPLLRGVRELLLRGVPIAIRCFEIPPMIFPRFSFGCDLLARSFDSH